MQEHWQSVLPSLQPLLRPCEDGDTNLRWVLINTLPALVHECSEVVSAEAPQPFVMRLYELMFVVRLMKAEAKKSLGDTRNLMQKCPSQSVDVLLELDAAAAAVAKSLASLLDIPKTEPKRPVLCLMKECYGLSLQQCALVALLAVGAESRVPMLVRYLSALHSQSLQVDRLVALDMTGMNAREFENFSNDETSIVKDGMLIVNTTRMHSTSNLTLKPEFCLLVNGCPLTAAQKDKLKHTIFWSQIRPYLQLKSSSESAQDIANRQQQRQQQHHEHHQPSASSPTPPINRGAPGSNYPDPRRSSPSLAQELVPQAPPQQHASAREVSSSSVQIPESDDLLSPSSPSCSDAGLPPYTSPSPSNNTAFAY